MRRRVVITGIGLVTPLGRGVDECWHALLGGRSGIGPISLFDARTLPVRIGGEAKGFDAEVARRNFPEAATEKDRKVLLGLEAGAQAVADANLEPAALLDAPVFIGTSLETFFLEDVSPVAHEADIGSKLADLALNIAQPVRLQTPLDRLGELLGIRYGLRGGRHTNCSACAAGAQAIGEAFRCLRRGDAATALAGAADSILNPLGLGGFALLQILSAENEHPTTACRPFDATRQGTVLSEGAAFVVLETIERALARGARIYAEVLGYGTTLDAYRISDPDADGRGAAASMERAVHDAALTTDQIDAINAHGTGTPKNDIAETRAIHRVFGPRAKSMPVTANKSMTGHMIAASGAVEAAASALSLATHKLPPTINRQHPDPECDLDYVTEGARQFSGDTVLSNSFGFGGQNACVVFRHYPA